jgi:hypothetical protein
MVRSCERVGWSGGKLDLVWTSLWCIDDSTWFLKAWMCCSCSFFLVIFGAFLGNFLGEISRSFHWGYFGGCMHEPFMVLFPLILLPNPWEKGLDFGVFVGLGFVVFLAKILWFLLIQRVLVDHNLAMECPWGVLTIPKVLFGSMERIRRSGVGFGGVDPRVLFIPSCPGYTSLTGALDWCDRCEPFVGFASGELLNPCVFRLCYCWSVLGLFGVVLLGFV